MLAGSVIAQMLSRLYYSRRQEFFESHAAISKTFSGSVATGCAAALHHSQQLKYKWRIDGA